MAASSRSPAAPSPDFEFHPPCLSRGAMDDDDPPASPRLNIPPPLHNWAWSNICHRGVLTTSGDGDLVRACSDSAAAATDPSQPLELQRVQPEEARMEQLDRHSSQTTPGEDVSGCEDSGCSCLCASSSSSSTSSSTRCDEEASEPWKLPGSCNGLVNGDDDGRAMCRKKLKQKLGLLILNVSGVSKAMMSRQKLGRRKGRSWGSSAGDDDEFSGSLTSSTCNSSCGSPAATSNSGSSSSSGGGSAPAASKSYDKMCSSPHARHYQQQRARSRELQRTTPLPYRPFMAFPGCLGGRAAAHIHVPSAARITPTPTPVQA